MGSGVNLGALQPLRREGRCGSLRETIYLGVLFGCTVWVPAARMDGGDGGGYRAGRCGCARCEAAEQKAQQPVALPLAGRRSAERAPMSWAHGDVMSDRMWHVR